MLAIISLILHLKSFGVESIVSRAFINAAEIYQSENFQRESYILKPEIRLILKSFNNKKIPPEILKPYIGMRVPQLSSPDKFDKWQFLKKDDFKLHFNIALHAIKIDVLESEDLLGDDLYAYFFITDGLIPFGKVTQIYSNIKSGQSFFLNAWDRIIYPVKPNHGRSPHRHLIIDYGIVESDGDDVKKLQQLSAVIIDIVLAVYASLEAENSSILLQLRRELKTLAEFIINLDNDDRLITSSFAYKTEEIDAMMKNKTFVDFKRKHVSRDFFDEWKYQVHFRLMRE